MGCIYLVTNTVNNKVYVGQTIRRLHERIREHKSRTTRRTHLTNAILKYGFDSFRFTVIDIGNGVDELNAKEAMWIDIFDSANRDKGYNLDGGGHNHKRSEETRRKMSEAKKGKIPVAANLVNPRKNRIALTCTDCIRTVHFKSIAEYAQAVNRFGTHAAQVLRARGFVMFEGMKCLPDKRTV